MVKYLYDGEMFDDIDEVLDAITDDFDESIYDDMLDDCYGDINICGIDYPASIALYRVDEIAYRCGMNDYIDTILSEISSELESIVEGDTLDMYGVEVEVVEVDDDDL